MEPPPLTEQTVTYQLSRKEAVRFLFFHSLRRGRMIRSAVVLLAVAAFCFYLGSGSRSLGFACVLFVLLFPLFYYRNVGRLIDKNPALTARRTLTFGPVGIMTSRCGTNTRMTWTGFKSFTENATYFVLRHSGYQMESILPKAAFTPQQQEEFRRYGEAINARGMEV